jgi:hypothetical protein
MFCEVRLDELAPLSRYAGERAFLVKLHKAAVPGNISRED